MQFSRRQRRLIQRQRDDAFANIVWNAVPDAIRLGASVSQGFGSAGLIQIVPAVEGGVRNADLFQRPPHRQGGLLDEPDDLELLGGGISHSASSPSPVTLFLSKRFSSVSSATTSFSALASRRRSLTSSEVAARAVSPASRFFPASRNSFDQR
jgi:hypothetical protein